MTQRRRIFLVLSLALLVVLAGCTGGDGGGDDTVTTTTSSSSSGGGAGGDGGGGDGGSGSGSGDSDTDGGAASDPDTDLSAFESYTVRYTFSSTTSGQQSGGEFLIQVDFPGETVYQRQSVGDGASATTFEYYRAPGEDIVYSRLDTGGDPVYQQIPADQAPIFLFADPIEGDVSAGPAGTGSLSIGLGADWRDDGIVQTDEGPRHKYVIDEAAVLEEDATIDQVEEVYIEYLVDEDRNIVTSFTYELTYVPAGQSESMTVRYALVYTDIGSTTVQAPEWAEEAKAATEGQDTY